MTRGGSPVILLVDDDKIDMMAVKRLLRKMKVAEPVIEAQDGIEALDHLRGRNGRAKISAPCLILLDLNMPRMSGLEFLDELRRDPLLRDTVVFVMSASIVDQELVRARDKYVAGYVMKGLPGEYSLEGMTALVDRWQQMWVAG